MKRFVRTLFIITLIVISVPTLTAQRFKAFSNDPTLTQEEMRTFAATLPKEKQKQAEEVLLKFDEFWNSSQMSEEFQMQFIEVGNLMLRKNLRFFPHFEAYIKAFDAFANSDMTDYNRQWLKMIQYNVNHDLSRFDKVMNNYVNIFNDNIIQLTPNSRWTAYGYIEKIGMDEEPYFEYKDIDLVGAGSRDSVEIIGTSGKYYPSSARWNGTKGSIYWYKAGLNGQVKATFDNYTVDTRQPKVRVENAKMYYPELFGAPVLGVLSAYPEEVREQLFDYINGVDFIKWLISPDRPYAKDCPHDQTGRVIVDLAHPHIIEDADYFRQPALHFIKHKCYTFLRPNSNPHSEYRKFWEEEKRRCYEGYVRESDGEWVTGYCYWFLNYNPMLVNMIVKGTKRADRIESFPFFFEGIYWRFHYLQQAKLEGQHAIELARRQCAKSYSLSSIMTHNLILGEADPNPDTHRRRTTVLTAYEKEYLKDDKDGTFSKFKPAMGFIFTHTPFPHLMLKNSPNEMSWQMGYKNELGVEDGSLNQVLGVSAKDNPDKLRGKRGWVLFEEMGSFKGLLALYDTTRKGVEDGNYAFATMYLVGTAAEKESDFTSAKTLLYNPEGYNIHSIPNVFDKKGQGKANFGFFFPAYINRSGCYNKDGVSDVVKALLEILLARYKAKYSADPQSVLRVIAEDPITPAEAIIKVKAAYFPTASINERISQLDEDPRAYNDVYVGNLVLRDGKVAFTPSGDIPIHKYGVDNSTRGAIEIFEMPEKNREGEVFNGRYIVGHDPVDNDQAESSSLSSTFVFDLFTDKIVAEYTGRQPFADDNFEIVRKLCLFYNARCLFESNKKGIFAYFSKMNCTHLLAETPEYLREKQLVKYSAFGSNKYGVNANAPINDYANGLLRDWLLKPITIINKRTDGELQETTIPMLYTIRNRALLEELASYTPELNVDRIRAMGMVMLYRQEKIILYQGDMSADRLEKANAEYLGNDKFFTDNYDKKMLKYSKYSKN